MLEYQQAFRTKMLPWGVGVRKEFFCFGGFPCRRGKGMKPVQKGSG